MKKRPGGRDIPLLRDQDVDDLAVLVDRAVQIYPLSGDLDMGLVHKPPIPSGVPAGSCRVDQQRSEPLHPPVDRDVVHLDTAFGQ